MRVYLDDLRATPYGFDTRVYTYAEAIEVLKTGKVTFFSFDHDLNAEGELELKHTGTGYDVACWVERQAVEGTLQPFKWAVHSANPVGALRIRQAMLSAERAWQSRNLL